MSVFLSNKRQNIWTGSGSWTVQIGIFHWKKINIFLFWKSENLKEIRKNFKMIKNDDF